MNANRRPIAPVRKLVAAVVGTIAVFVMVFGLGMTSWPIVALGVAMLAFSIVLAMVNVVRRGARTWVAGTAHVTQASEPPPSSTFGRCELQVVVAAPGLPTSAVKVRDPRVPMDRWPVVGDTLPIMVDVDDLRRIRIRWSEVPTHTEAAMRPTPAYTDPLDDYATADDLLGEPEPPPWVTRDRQWGPGVDEPDSIADLDEQLDELREPAVSSDHPMLAHDTVGAGPVVLEGTLVDPDPRPSPLPRRPRPSPHPRPGSASSSAGSPVGSPASASAGSATATVDGDRQADPTAQATTGPTIPSQTTPQQADPHVAAPNLAETDLAETNLAETNLAETDPARPDPAGSGPAKINTASFETTTVAGAAAPDWDHEIDLPLDGGPVDPLAVLDPEEHDGHPPHSTQTAPGTHTIIGAQTTAGPQTTAGSPAAGSPAAGGPQAAADYPSGPLTDVYGGASWVRQESDVLADDQIDDVLTAYPSARPGPAGAIHGVGITVLVTDLDRSVAFYRDMLGFFEIDGGHGSAVLASGDTRLVLRTVHDLSPMTGRLIYLNLEVGDLDAVYDELQSKGVPFVHGPRPVNRGGRLELWAASFHDPDGHNIAVTQWRARG